MDSCIALWHEHKSGAGDQKVLDLELHINLWRLKGRGGNRDRKGVLEDILDIGFLITDPNKARCIKLFVPFKLGNNEISDLGVLFKKHQELVATVFNEDYEVVIDPHAKTMEVRNRNKVTVFNVYLLDIKNDVRIRPKYGGSVIRIRVPDDPPPGTLYYRMRIKSEGLGVLRYTHRPFNSIMESAFWNTELIDFRLNEKRNLPSSLLEDAGKTGIVSLSAVQFFVMREASHDYISSHKPLHRTRPLEPGLWDSYLGEEYVYDRLVAYQWRESDSTESFSAFVKYKYLKSNWATIAIFLVILLLVGLIGGLLANWIFACAQRQ